MARAQALDLAAPVDSTIAALRALHPPDDHCLPSDGPRYASCPLEELSPPPGASEEPLRRDTFHSVFYNRLPRASAADHAGWRYEYLSWAYRYGSSTRPDQPRGTPAAFVPGRGADALFRLCSLFFSGGLPESVRPWFLGGRLIALCKDGDRPDAEASGRKLRPIAIGSTIARAISMVAAAQYRLRFASYLQPPPPAWISTDLPARWCTLACPGWGSVPLGA